MGNLGLLLKLKAWWDRFIGILKGEIAPTPLPYKEVDAWILQLTLLRRGYKVGMTGVLDQQTRDALKEFQFKNGLTPDGLFGPMTWEKLR